MQFSASWWGMGRELYILSCEIVITWSDRNLWNDAFHILNSDGSGAVNWQLWSINNSRLVTDPTVALGL